ncbi:MAG: TonB family protein [Rhodocyclaceae bacterium]|nr:TonB family protein [Rhodocyclaceae bacterium]
MPQQGKLAPALAISFLLHALLLWPAVSLYRQNEIAQALAVTLRPANGSAPVVPRPALPAPLLRETRLPSPHADTKPALLTSPTPAQDSTPTSTTEMPARSETSAAAADGKAADAPSPPGGAAHPGAGLDADGVRQYRLALAVAARRFKRYPPQALAEEIGGTVEVLVAVSAGGQSQEIALGRSSGHAALDDAALDMMRQAAPRTAVPEALRRHAFVVNLPVIFDVADE